MESLRKAYQILGELINEDCFDFEEVRNLSFDKRKEYLREKIIEYFKFGEVNLADIIERVDSSDYIYEGVMSLETIENINDFFHNEELVADVILLMDEDIYFDFEKDIGLR